MSREIRVKGEFDPLRVTRISHDYADHPLLQADALRALANRLYDAGTDKVKFIDPGAHHGSAFHLATESHDGRTVDQVFDSLSHPGTWIAIYEAETDPIYRDLIHEIIDSARSLVEAKDPEIFDSDAYIFISAPPSVSPFHIDRENNFFLQICGTKRMSVWRPDDRETVSEHGVEGWIVRGSLDSVVFDEGHLARAEVHDLLRPGEGVYMPSTSPHMTETEPVDDPDDPGYSISIGVVYYTRNTRRRANVYASNVFLKKLGLPAHPPRARWNAIEALKYALGVCATRVLSWLGRFRIQRGM